MFARVIVAIDVALRLEGETEMRAAGLRTQNEVTAAFDWASWGAPFEPQGKAMLRPYIREERAD